MKLTEFNNAQIVTIAVALLGGYDDYLDREDIAIKADEIASGRFNWRKYPDRIDLSPIRDALSDAKKEKNGCLLVGNNTDGWMLSHSGVEWINTLDLQALVTDTEAKHRRSSISASQEAECIRLRTTRAFQCYKVGSLDDITLQDFYQFARVNEYFPPISRERRYTIIDSAVLIDSELAKLWSYLKERYPKEFE